MYVAVDVAAYQAMEKERREAEAARIQAVRNAAEHQIALDTRRQRQRHGAEQREYRRGRAGPARRRRGAAQQSIRRAGGGARGAAEAPERDGGGGAARPRTRRAIAIERAERIHELERSLAEELALQVARAELEESLAARSERDGALAGLEAAAGTTPALARSGDARTPCGAPTTTSWRSSKAPPRPARPEDAAHRMSVSAVRGAEASGRGHGAAAVAARAGGLGMASSRPRSGAAASRARRTAIEIYRRSAHKQAAFKASRRSCSRARGPRDRAERRRRALEPSSSAGAATRCTPAGGRGSGARPREWWPWRRSSSAGPSMREMSWANRRPPPGPATSSRRPDRGAREEARPREYCGAPAPTRGGDGADEERGAAARAVPRPLHRGTYRALESVRRAGEREGFPRICWQGAERRSARPRAAPLADPVSNVAAFRWLRNGEANRLTFMKPADERVRPEGEGGGQRPRRHG